MNKKECLIYKIKYNEYNDDKDLSVFQIYIDTADYSNLIADFYYRYSDYVDSHALFKTS